MTKVLVTGGAGMLGREVVKQLTETGYSVRIMTHKRQPTNLLSATEWAQADLETGRGIPEAVTGIDVVVHAASSPFKHTQQIDVEGTRLLLEQARVAGVAHVIFISIVGVDLISYYYYRAKLAAEELVKSSGIPWSLLRATQFHYLVNHFLLPGADNAMHMSPGVWQLPFLVTSYLLLLLEAAGTIVGYGVCLLGGIIKQPYNKV